MDSYLGDLADIVRATSTTVSSGFNNTISNPSIAVTTSMTTDNDRRPYHHHHHHQPPAAADWTSFHANANSSMEFSSPRAINQHPNSILSHDGDFGDPFSSTRDPLLEIGTELDAIGATTTLHHTGFFSHHERSTCAAAAASDMNMNITGGGGGRLSGGSCRTEVDGKQRGEQKMAAAEEDMTMPTASSDSNHTNIFSRILQISPSSNKLIPIPNSCSPSASTVITSAASPTANIRSCTSTAASASALPPAATAAAAVGFMSDDDMINNNPIGNCTPAAGATAALQISSPRNPGIKRRKSQAKKVVCIPAPAATNSRQGGEVVPSDLWAWRKYGQKPIKGSPYPRGYYRCSSSKGCSARKQVERSRTDPNMLVITYTSEHNHPWPTQRNALAGSTRTGQSSSSKSTSTAAGGNSPAAAAAATAKPSEINARVSVKQGNNRDGIGDDTVNNDSNSNNRMDSDAGRRMDVMMTCNNSGGLNGTGDQYLVKEEVMLSCVNKGGDDDDVHQTKGGENEGHREGLHHQHQLGDQLLADGTDHLYSSYRPIMPGDQCNYLQKQQPEDPQDSFFADLGELETDPLTLLFRGGGDHDRRDGNNAAAVAAALLDNDPFSGMFDWVAVHNNDESSSSRKM